MIQIQKLIPKDHALFGMGDVHWQFDQIQASGGVSEDISRDI